MYDFTTEQKEFLSSAGKVVLHACPGSGKTTIVAQKVINYLMSWNRPHQGSVSVIVECGPTGIDFFI